MKKFKVFLDIEKEETWLNKMSEQGYNLVSKHTRYEFEPKKEDKVFRLDFRAFKKKQDYLEYKLLFEDSGWTYVAGSKNSGTHYFCKTIGDDVDDIFSDEESRVAKLKRYTSYWAAYTVILLILTGGFSHLTVNPKDLFLTPGLWEKIGSEFWRAFWFEMPAVILRAFYSFGFILLIFGYIYMSYASAKKLLKNKL